MRILVIGGTRFIGPPTVARLHELGHELTLFHRGRTEADLPAGIAHLHGDRERLADFADTFRRLAPDVVLDTRPLVERDARTAVDVFRGVARRFVAISSGDVYRAWGRLIGSEPGPPDPVPLTEDAPLREQLYPNRGKTLRGPGDDRRWQDDYDKILVERVVMGNPDLPGTILRLPMVYGPGDEQHRLFPILKRIDDGRQTILLDEGLAHWRASRGYVENVAAAVALAVTNGRAVDRVYNVAEREALSEADWVREIGRAAGWPGEVVSSPRDHLPPALVARIGTSQHLVMDTGRIRQELGYHEPVPRDEALRRAVAWERANPPEPIDPRKFDYAAEDAVLAELARHDR